MKQINIRPRLNCCVGSQINKDNTQWYLRYLVVEDSALTAITKYGRKSPRERIESISERAMTQNDVKRTTRDFRKDLMEDEPGDLLPQEGRVTVFFAQTQATARRLS